MTRPTDADVDGLSRVYCASWKGATFDWAGPDVGYIVQVKPKGFKAEPLPDFAKAKDEELVKVLESASNRRRMEAQRELVRRDWGKVHDVLLSETNDTQSELRLETLVAAVGVFVNHPQASGVLESAQNFSYEGQKLQWNVSRHMRHVQVDQPKNGSPGKPFYITTKPRFVGRDPEDASIMRLAWIEQSVATKNARRLVMFSSPDVMTESEVLRPILVEASRRMGAETSGEWFKQLDETKHPYLQDLSLRCLRVFHTAEVVTGLIERLGKATDPALRQGILAALCRLHFKEGEWKGDSWGTRPDTRGPYYQPEAWSETPKIAVALKDALAKATPEEAAFLVKELNRNRIQFNEAQQRILELAKKDPKVLPELAAQLAGAEEIPAEAVPLLVGALKSSAGLQPAQTPPTGDGLKPTTTFLSQAITALAKTDSAEGVSATLAALEPLKKLPDSWKDYDAALAAFLNAPKLENHHQLVEQIAEKAEWPVSMYANAALLNLANRKTGSPESIQLTQKALDKGWTDPKHRKLIIDAISASKHMPSAAKVLAALDDPDAEVKGAAERAAKAMRIQKIEDKTPKIMTLKPEEALAAVLKEKGDIALGEQIFTKATCVACHTVKETEAQKGPYLGNIAQTYKRPDLAQNILDPNKTIAQGFASEMITMKGGTQQMGFITLEGANEVKLRNIASQEFTFKTADIKERQKLPMSMMPPGLMMNFTVKEFASLLDYLESLVKK
jgi:putative heme-binding domain-containing protein